MAVSWVLERRVLLLNGGNWEPLIVISLPRALNLILEGKAVIVEETGEVLRSVSRHFPVPSVIALQRFVNVPRRRAHWCRKSVLERDAYRCIYCGIRLGDFFQSRIVKKVDFTIDHIVPRSRGGSDVWTNTACACSRCNHRKGGRLPHEAGMRLLWEPKRPRTSYLVIAYGSGPICLATIHRIVISSRYSLLTMRHNPCLNQLHPSL